MANLIQELLHFFPPVEAPVTLAEDMAVAFSSHNRPLPQELIDKVLLNWDTIDEFGELVPCFSLPENQEFYTLVYWKGALLSHEYIMVTVGKDGILISKKVIAGTISNGESVIRSVAVIDEDFNIFCTVGAQSQSSRHYNPSESNAFKFEILPDGIITSTQEEIDTWEEREEK
ncbi:MAG: hypothetical protein HKN09_10875 [Saprospiraceae bacterium]|nr:hypothetical protein [Saprospiraceae bacterium]